MRLYGGVEGGVSENRGRDEVISLSANGGRKRSHDRGQCQENQCQNFTSPCPPLKSELGQRKGVSQTLLCCFVWDKKNPFSRRSRVTNTRSELAHFIRLTHEGSPFFYSGNEVGFKKVK